MPLRSSPILALVLAASVACAPGGEPRPAGAGGTVVFASFGDPEHLVPPLVASLTAKQVIDQLFAPLVEVGPSRNTVGDADFIPRAAERWSWSSDSGAIDFSLRPGARFHDGTPVTAADVRFSWELLVDPAVASPHVSSLPPVDSVVALDSFTVRVHFGDRSPERFFKFATNLFVLPRHLVDTVARATLASSGFASRPVGSGPYRFVKWERGVALELAADTANAEGRPAIDRLIWRPAADPNAAARAVVAGEADFVELLRPEGIAMLGPSVPARALEYAAPQVGYVLLNTRATTNRRAPHPILGDRQLRRALAMALDRAAVVRNALDTLAVLARGPLPRSSWAADSSITALPFARDTAVAVLDAAGWRDTNGDGIRDRNGAPLRLSLLVPSTSATRRQMATVLQDQWRQVGVDVVVEALEPSVVLPRLASGRFDAFIHVWQSDATPASLVQAWGSRDLERSANYGWYASAAVDSALDRAVSARSMAEARGHYAAAARAIVEDAPAVFLWEPRSFALAHRRIRIDRLADDAWWSGIRRWHIPEGERIARDQLVAR